MSQAEAVHSAVVEQFPRTPRSVITDELNRILVILQDSCPPGARISFDFDGRLHVHVDVRTAEEVAQVEATLASVAGGLFHGLRRGKTPHHPFFHRVSALIDA